MLTFVALYLRISNVCNELIYCVTNKIKDYEL